MSVHSSLKISGKLKGQRNVWTRVERIQALRKVGLWQEEGGAVTGLPKVRTRFKVKTKKVPKAEAAAAVGAEGVAAAAPAAAGAAAAAPAAGDKKAGAAPAAGADKKGADKKGGDKKADKK